ncbi:MAG: polymer-forming cytoskeletal protein [Candidatus Kerfeldbacteria bacterium]|nr:polymer-forming cytoskeletal protein [Candidatus Kerfeldbacteria bacterium]
MAMFSREPEVAAKSPETIIGPSVKVEGNFIGSGNVVVEGTVNGSLKTSKDLRIGEGAKVKADIEAANVTVAGEVHGNVRTAGKLELGPSAKVLGNVEVAVLVVAQGAILNGKCVMVKPETVSSSPPIPHPEKKKSFQA